MPARADTGTVLKRIVDEVIFPRYRALLDAASLRTQAWVRYCAVPSDAELETLREAYRVTAGAWGGAWVRPPPVAYGDISPSMGERKK